MFVTERDYWVRKEYYADLRRQAQQERLMGNQRRHRLHWRSLLTRVLDTVLGPIPDTVPSTIGNRLIHWKEGVAKQQVHRFENEGITSAL